MRNAIVLFSLCLRNRKIHLVSFHIKAFRLRDLKKKAARGRRGRKKSEALSCSLLLCQEIEEEVNLENSQFRFAILFVR